MKRARLFAWLLIVAMLTVACPAFGEELTIDANDGVVLELEDGIEVDDSGDAVDPELDGGDLSLELPDLDLSDGLDDTLPGVPEGDLSANGGDADSLTGVYYPRNIYDNDALFAGYVDMLFGKTGALGLQSNGWVGDRLTGASAKAYKYLLAEIKKVAAGTRSNTEFTIPSCVLSDSEAADVYYGFSSIVDALLVDCPYHLFWYDKTESTYYGVNNGVFYARFPVAQEFASGTYTTNVNKIKSANNAAANAKAVVKKYAGASDYKKLCGYRDYICQANTYNDDAAAGNYAYGNPWQLIWVFDGNSSTNVVCEGYSKAFQYLCDLSSFKSSIQCHVVSGWGGSASDLGPHMWNVVTMGDGKNYHTDITFVDSGLPEAFLAGAASTEYEGFYCVANLAYYRFDDETLRTYPAKTLNLSTKDYDPKNPDKPTTAPTKVTLNKTKATVVAGASLTLKAKVEPSGAKTTLTWSSSDKKVATVSSKGVVKALKEGTTTITVKTANGKKATCKITVPTAPTKIKFAKKRYSVKVGETVTLGTKLTPGKAKTTLTWSSSDKKIATVSSKGVVKGIKKGTATITVKTANGKKATCKITVPEAPTKIAFTKKSYSVKVGKTVTLGTKLTPGKAKTTLTWSSSDKKIATVSSKGVVKGIKKGTVTITVKTSNGKTATVKVTVK